MHKRFKDMIKDKKGYHNIQKYVEGIIIGVLGIVVIFALVAGTFPTLVSSGAELNSSGLPLVGTFFASGSSVGWLILGAVILLAIISLLFGFMGKKGRK